MDMKLLTALLLVLPLPLLAGCGASTSLFDKDADGYPVGEDCDDYDPEVGPRYLDADGDGYGVGSPKEGCDQGDLSFYAKLGDDCDDNDSSTYPDATESCDGVDSNCDGLEDEVDYGIYHPDMDDDGFGNGETSIESCEVPGGYVLDDTDCNDNNSATYPGASELCDEEDNDCDSEVDEGLDQTFYEDVDEDSFGDAESTTEACAAPTGFVASSTDCNDSDSEIYPGSKEICDEIDNDCDGYVDENVGIVYYQDNDKDGYGAEGSEQVACQQPEGYVTTGGDCADGLETVNPGVEEICDTVDNNCDGAIDEDLTTRSYPDKDNDEYGASGEAEDSCEVPDGNVLVGHDCDDTDATINPDGVEACNAKDDDCDGSIDEDFDDDGDGYSECNGDCDDDNGLMSPDAEEICDGLDNDCSGVIDGDEFEPNDTREDAYILGDLNGFYDINTYTLSATIHGDSDTFDFYEFTVTDDSYLPEEFFVKATLTDIPAGANYDLYLWWDDPDDVYYSGVEIIDASENTGDSPDEVKIEGIAGFNDGGLYWIEVFPVEGSDCEKSYTLTIENRG